MKAITTIDDVIYELTEIVKSTQASDNPLGYFAALYRRVTIKVKEGIATNFFEDGPRMAQLDIVFAKRYLDAYYAFEKSEPLTDSWQRAFDLSTNYWPIVLQHLLIGINAHINLDLGIAAAEISKGKSIHSLENDFNKINQILSDLVVDVESELATIWPTLKRILKKTRNVDDFLVDFSMELARDGAWRFAIDLAASPSVDWEKMILHRDERVAANVSIITYEGILVSTLMKVVRLGERGTIGEKIGHLSS